VLSVELEDDELTRGLLERTVERSKDRCQIGSEFNGGRAHPSILHYSARSHRLPVQSLSSLPGFAFGSPAGCAGMMLLMLYSRHHEHQNDTDAG
jgi:hypothetical protein